MLLSKVWKYISVSCEVKPSVQNFLPADYRHSVQKIQLLPAKDASLRLIPNMLIGFILNPIIGLAVQHVRIDYLLTIASMLSAVAPFLLALTDPAWPYWYAEFWSMLLCGVAVDGMWP